MKSGTFIKLYKRDGRFVVETCIEVSATDAAQGTSEVADFETFNQQIIYAREIAALLLAGITRTYYKGYYIHHGKYGDGTVSVDVDGVDKRFATDEEAEAFIDKQPDVGEFEV